jgi:hypothetical protein
VVDHYLFENGHAWYRRVGPSLHHVGPICMFQNDMYECLCNVAEWHVGSLLALLVCSRIRRESVHVMV